MHWDGVQGLVILRLIFIFFRGVETVYIYLFVRVGFAVVVDYNGGVCGER